VVSFVVGRLLGWVEGNASEFCGQFRREEVGVNVEARCELWILEFEWFRDRRINDGAREVGGVSRNWGWTCGRGGGHVILGVGFRWLWRRE